MVNDLPIDALWLLNGGTRALKNEA